MIPHRPIHVLFLLGLTLSLFSAGCVSTTTENVESTIEQPVQVPEEYTGGIYEAGDETYPGGYYIHTVELADESISIIAKWFTGNMMNWEVLAKCNPSINPNRIFLGNKIRIPRSLMTRQDPMTAEFVQESQPHPKKKGKTKPKPSPAKAETPDNKTQQPTVKEPAVPPAPEEAEPVEDEPLLFGPKDYSKDS